MSENQSFSSHGFTVLYRFSPASTVVKPSAAALEQLVAAGLAELSDQPDGKLDDIRVTRDGYMAEFIPLQLPTGQVTVLTTRQGPMTAKARTGGKLMGRFDDYGGYFERANFVGIFLVKVGTAAHEETATASGCVRDSEQVREDVSISFTPTPVQREKAFKTSPTADRKKQLYRSLFDEDEEVDPATDSSSKENAKMSRKKGSELKGAPYKDSQEERSRNKSKQTLLAVRKDTGQRQDTPVEPYSPSSHSRLTGADEINVPSYQPTGSSSSSNKSARLVEYVPEYVPGSIDAKGTSAGSDIKEYVPTKLSRIPASIGRIPKIPGYVPQPTKSSSSNDGQSCPSYKPGVRRTASVLTVETSPDEYEPTMTIASNQHHPVYRPSAKRSNCRSGDTDPNGDSSSVYEPTGGDSDAPALEYYPSRITKPVKEVKATEERVKLRPRKGNSTSSSSPPPGIEPSLQRNNIDTGSRTSRQQPFHPRQRIGGVPEKCLMPEECFDWCSGMLQDRYVPQSEGGYIVSKEQNEFDEQIRRVRDVRNLGDDQIRFVFYRLENHLLAIPRGCPNDFHRLFMADHRDVLRFTLPIKAFKQCQQTLVRNLLSDNFSTRRGFDIQYTILVLMPEVLIHLHMAVHGGTYAESWKALDPGVYNWQGVLNLIKTPAP